MPARRRGDGPVHEVGRGPDLRAPIGAAALIPGESPGPRARPRILFIIEGTSLAHIARPYVLATALDPARYDVHVAAPPRPTVERLFTRERFRRSVLVPTEWSGRLNRVADALFWSEAEILRSIDEDRALIQELRPHLVVVDQRPSIQISGRLEGVPTASITSAIWTDDLLPTWRQPGPDTALSRPYVPVLTQAGYDLVAPVFMWLATRSVNEARRRHGLGRLPRKPAALFAADHLLFLETPGLFQLPPHRSTRHHFLGPALWSVPAPLPPWWDGLDDDVPLVYVGLGTSGTVSVLPAILDALARIPCRVAVATGGRPIPTHVPQNAFVAPFLPGDLLARRAALVISNGGSPGLYQALNEGTPVLGIPQNIDQHRTMAAVAWRGATLTVRSDQVSSRRVRRAVLRILSEGSFRRAAAEIASEFRRYPVTELFPKLVDSIVGG
jgi:UDP:flavonoid glycosyltransferase YjiC (YdhE family)